MLGRTLLPMLVEAGHDVVGTTRSAAKADSIRASGAQPVVLDALDRDAVLEAVREAAPDVVIHQLTAIERTDFKRFDQSFAVTNQLRTRGLDHLLDAAQAAGAKRFIAQSFTGWTNKRTGGVKTEEDPLDDQPARGSEKSLAAIRYLENAVTTANSVDGLVLRYGLFYGPGTALGPGGEMLEAVRQRKLPVAGGGGGVLSFVHVADAAAATVAAVDRGRPGIYNVVDDDPAPVSVWLPYLAEAVDAGAPRRVPAWLVRPMLGELGVAFMTTVRGSSNIKAKRELGWTLRYPSWRQGFRSGLG